MFFDVKKYIFIYIFINVAFIHTQKEYQHYDYDQIMKIFTDLSKTCSNYIKIDISQNRYNLNSIEGCGENKTCQNLIVFLTDFDSYTLDRPVYYISGEVHGNEVLGPSSVTEFAKYFCETYKNKKNSLYHNILKTKLIIITPMTNAYGYYNKKREEKVFYPKNNSYSLVDPNRDFPYFNTNNTSEVCMETIAGRTINEIFNEFIVGGGITFHGGTTCIGYPWGNYIHEEKIGDYKTKSTEAPDFNAFEQIGQIMQKFSSSKDNEENNIRGYILGDMSSTVYSINGGLEDWAYGGWENKAFKLMGNNNLRPIKTCNPESFEPYDMIWSNNYNVYNYQDLYDDINYDYKLRCLIYLVEMADKKIPKKEYYGINDFDINNKGDIFDFNKTTNFYGHIPRNLRMMYPGIDLISASFYIDTEKIEIQKMNNINKIIIPFVIMGCLSLKKYSIYRINFDILSKKMIQVEYLRQNENKSLLFDEETNEINCYYNDFKYYNLIILTEEAKSKKYKRSLRNRETTETNNTITFDRPGGNYDRFGETKKLPNPFEKDRYISKKGSIYYIKGVQPDAEWGVQKKPDPNVGPQSHVARSKINSSYYINNGNYTLKSNYHFYSYPIVAFENGDFQIVDDIDSFFYQEDFDFLELIITSNKENYKINTQIYCHQLMDKKNENKNYLSSENFFQFNLEITIFEQKGNFLKNALDNKKEIKLFSQTLLSQENEIYSLKNEECEIFGDSILFIKCANIITDINGNFIRNKLANSLLSFELKVENDTFLNFFGHVSLKNDNKGKYYVNYYDDKDKSNKMFCSSNFPSYIYSYFYDKKNIYLDEIYYLMNITKISNTKLRINIEIKQNSDNDYIYNYFILYFPFFDDIEIFDIKNKIFETEITLNEQANGKIIGKTVYIIPIEDEDFYNIYNLTYQTNHIMSMVESLNQISKNRNYKLIPCSIMSYNSVINSDSANEIKKLFEKLNNVTPFIYRRHNVFGKIESILINSKFSIILIGIISFIIVVFIITCVIKEIKKRRNPYASFQEDSVKSNPGVPPN